MRFVLAVFHLHCGHCHEVCSGSVSSALWTRHEVCSGSALISKAAKCH